MLNQPRLFGGIKEKTMTQATATLENFDIITIEGKSGLFFCTKPMRKFYDCGNGYREHCAVVQPFKIDGGVFGNAFPVYHSQLSKVRVLTDADFLVIAKA
tara:strand:+ start:223 stop:522 length:300 start_codon:yes stop_codon:yes gene_type:complete